MTELEETDLDIAEELDKIVKETEIMPSVDGSYAAGRGNQNPSGSREASELESLAIEIENIGANIDSYGDRLMHHNITVFGPPPPMEADKPASDVSTKMPKLHALRYGIDNLRRKINRLGVEINRIESL